jgi:hypothetical protein
VSWENFYLHPGLPSALQLRRGSLDLAFREVPCLATVDGKPGKARVSLELELGA